MLRRAAGGGRGEPDRRRRALGSGGLGAGPLSPPARLGGRGARGHAQTGLADAGYRNEAELARLEARGVYACVALARDGSKRPAADPVICPATRRMAEKPATPEGKARYARRKRLSEAPNGWIKEATGFRRFSVRGLAKARGEQGLAFPALNVVRMGRLAARQRGNPVGHPRLKGPRGGHGRDSRAAGACLARDPTFGKALQESAPPA